MTPTDFRWLYSGLSFSNVCRFKNQSKTARGVHFVPRAPQYLLHIGFIVDMVYFACETIMVWVFAICDTCLDGNDDVISIIHIVYNHIFIFKCV